VRIPSSQRTKARQKQRAMTLRTLLAPTVDGADKSYGQIAGARFEDKDLRVISLRCGVGDCQLHWLFTMAVCDSILR